MATTALTVQVISRTGLGPTYASAATGDGNVFNNSGRNVFLHVKNASGSPITVQIDTPGLIDGLNLPTKDISVPATTGERMIGPFPVMYEQYDSDNSIAAAVKVTYSAVTSVTVAAIQLPMAAI